MDPLEVVGRLKPDTCWRMNVKTGTSFCLEGESTGQTSICLKTKESSLSLIAVLHRSPLGYRCKNIDTREAVQGSGMVIGRSITDRFPIGSSYCENRFLSVGIHRRQNGYRFRIGLNGFRYRFTSAMARTDMMGSDPLGGAMSTDCADAYVCVWAGGNSTPFMVEITSNK
jgi:hypothetical protein